MMRNKFYLIFLLLLVMVIAGCTNTPTATPNENPSENPGNNNESPETTPTDPNYQIVFVKNNNEIAIKEVLTEEETLIFTSDYTIDIIVPNPTMQVIAFTTTSDDGTVSKLHIYDWENDQLLNVNDLETEMPLINWSPDGCYLMLYEATGQWGDALIYDFVNHTVCSNLIAIGEPNWNPDSNRVIANSPEEVDDPLPYGDGHSSSIIVFNIGDQLTTTILKGSSDIMYWPLKWADENTIIYEQIMVDAEGEMVLQLDLNTSETIDISDQIDEVLYPQIEVPDIFYDYQYYEYSADDKYALLCSADLYSSTIKIWDVADETISDFADGYCAYWVSWIVE